MVRRQNGFTLVEIVMVMAVLATLLAIVAPRIDRERFRLDAAVQTVALEMTAAQRKAVLLQHDVVLRFDLEAGTVAVELDANNNGERDPGEDRHVMELEEGVVFGRAGAPALPSGPGPVTFHEDERGDPHLTFHRNGAASEFGVFYLTSAAGAPRYTRAVELVRTTGELTCHSYREETWTLTC